MTAGINPWQGIEKVVVVGLGVTGLSVVKHLVRQSEITPLSIQVIDTRTSPPGKEQLPDGIELHCGSWHIDWLLQADLIVMNPGIALSTPEVQSAIAQGISVIGDIELFAWAVDKPVIAITGSNGKSTVTDLTGVMANAAGIKTVIGGNIGVPALDLLTLDADLYVLELSSFQLETTSNLMLEAAAFLNLSEDHMDRYVGMADYAKAKQRIFDHANVAVVNRAEAETLPTDAQCKVVTFGYDDQEFGLLQKSGHNYLSIQGQPIVDCDELALVGRHNYANALVAMALLQQVNVDLKLALPALKNYQGLSHRCQVVAQKAGVKWVNDSKATNVASTLAALSGLECKGLLYLLVGGVGKGADFSDLAPALAALNVKLYCYGVDGEKFLSLHPSAKYFMTMDEAIAEFAGSLQCHDMVMLSPACASFDQYQNFMARGEAFITLSQQYTQ